GRYRRLQEIARRRMTAILPTLPVLTASRPQQTFKAYRGDTDICWRSPGELLWGRGLASCFPKPRLAHSRGCLSVEAEHRRSTWRGIDVSRAHGATGR